MFGSGGGPCGLGGGEEEKKVSVTYQACNLTSRASVSLSLERQHSQNSWVMPVDSSPVHSIRNVVGMLVFVFFDFDFDFDFWG